MEIRETPGVDKNISIKDAWEIMKENNAVTLPITKEDGRLEGLITTGDIAKSYMDAHDNFFLSRARTKYQSIAKTVEGEIIVGNEHACFTRGRVFVGAAYPDKMGTYLEENDLVILGDRREDQLCALQHNVSCMIICVGGEADEDIRKSAEEKQIVIIKTPLDTFTVARLINQSIPLRSLMKTENLITFQTDDFTDNIKEVMATNRHRAFPVINKHGKYVGTVSRRNLLGMKKKQLILVDHNEKSQAVDNVEAADILEIVDHHRLGSLETIQPIFFRNQPVGCTATIMYQIYSEKALEITPSIAGLLCAAIISDTLMFRSPTCTFADKMAAGALAQIAGIDIEKFAAEMFQAGSNLTGKSPEEIFYQDFKKFIVEEDAFGVGQISSMSTEELPEVKARMIPSMKNECGENSNKLIEEAFPGAACTRDGSYLLTGVVSRKKQLIPYFMSTIQQNG